MHDCHAHRERVFPGELMFAAAKCVRNGNKVWPCIRPALLRGILFGVMALLANVMDNAFAQASLADPAADTFQLEQVSFKRNFVVANGIKQHAVTGGSGEPVILLHGWPQTWRTYSKLMPLLVNKGYRVIAVDLRGLGDTEVKPPYSYRVSADDIAELMKALGVGRAHVVSHDLGVPIAYIFASRHPELVRTLSVLDVPIQGFGLDEFARAAHLWHFEFLQWPSAAEQLIPGKEREFYSLFYRTGRRGTISETNRDIYLRAYSRAGGLAASIGWFRDAWLEGERQIFQASEKRLEMPVLALGGEYAGGLAPLQSMRQLAQDVHGGFMEGVGHHLAEEAPDELAGLLLEHFARGRK
jgi:pimeloyl-ACP methyl ester carboxylesterase